MDSNETNAVSMIVLHAGGLCDAARDALKACAAALDHANGPLFLDVEGLSARELLLAIHESDPWDVVAVDVTSIDALREAFALAEGQFAPDVTTIECGYTLVAVPDFEACLDDQTAKRVAWGRLKAARYPGRAC